MTSSSDADSLARVSMAGQTRYERELRRQMRSGDLVPELAAPEFLRKIDGLAERALLKRSVDGNLGAILIYHQLVEEMIRLLLRDCQLFIRLAVFPAEMHFPTRRKQSFGQLQQGLSESVSFPKKDQILKRAGQLNALRNAVVHGLVQKRSLAGLRRQVLRAQRLYRQTYNLFDTSHDFFRVCFKDFRKDEFEEY